MNVLFVKLCLCVLYRSLNVRPVDPIYFMAEVVVCTSAWYTTGPARHSPFNGQFAGIRQLHDFLSFSGLLLFMTLLLCLLICLAIFSR